MACPALGGSGQTTTTTSSTTAPAAAPQARSAAEAFTGVCRPCHGSDGRGGVAPPLVPMTKSTAEVLAIVREGFGQMPPVSASELTDQEVAGIVEHLRSIR